MATYIVLLGPPGVGKGTQAQVISEQTGQVHISSGQLFRENLKSNTDLGKIAKSYMDRGDLVPDDVTIGMLRERLAHPDCKAGAILDGFPRTPAQADACEQMLTEFKGRISLVPYISAPEDVLVERISGRLVCRMHGHAYHQRFEPPKQAGICDIDGSELYQRDDDKAETVKRRIAVYLEQTAPLVGYYRQRGILVQINGDLPVEEVTAQLMAALRKVVE